MQEHAERRGLLSQPWRLLFSSLELTNGTIITPLLLFHLQLGLVFKKNYRFVEYTSVKSFNNYEQSVVNACRRGDENPNSSVVAETSSLQTARVAINLLLAVALSITKCTNDEKTQAAIKKKCSRV